jgi:hypothetical protein
MNPTKFLFVSCLVAIILFAFFSGNTVAEETNAGPDLYGSWELMKLETGGMSIQFTLIIKEDEIIASNTCAFKEYSVLAEVSAPAVITSEEIRVLASNNVEKEHSPGFLRCNASVQKGNMQYQLEDDKLILSMAGVDETVALTRIHR